jgi:hypothetical protein
MCNWNIFFEGKEDIELIRFKDDGKFLGYEIVPLIKAGRIGIEKDEKRNHKDVYFLEVDGTPFVVRTLTQNAFPHLCIGNNFDIISYLNQFYRSHGFYLQSSKPYDPFSEVWRVKKK